MEACVEKGWIELYLRHAQLKIGTVSAACADSLIGPKCVQDVQLRHGASDERARCSAECLWAEDVKSNQLLDNRHAGDQAVGVEHTRSISLSLVTRSNAPTEREIACEVPLLIGH